MTTTIKCDQHERFDFDACIMCKRLSITRTPGKGTKWSCSLNRKTAAEKRNFYTIWAEDALIDRGVMRESSRSTVVVEYVGKKKRGIKNGVVTDKSKPE